jgi:hypothetical protein
MGEGWDGGGHRGSFPPHLNPPPPWGEEVIFLTHLGLYYRKLDRPQRKIYFDPFNGAQPCPLGWCTKGRSESTLRSGLQAGEPKG